jgi:hypothetical protein
MMLPWPEHAHSHLQTNIHHPHGQTTLRELRTSCPALYTFIPPLPRTHLHNRNCSSPDPSCSYPHRHLPTHLHTSNSLSCISSDTITVPDDDALFFAPKPFMCAYMRRCIFAGAVEGWCGVRAVASCACSLGWLDE